MRDQTSRTGAGVIALIMVAILGWGVFHAIGAYSLNHNPWRPVVVMAFSLGFLGFWIALLAMQRRRLDRSRTEGGSKSNIFQRDEP